MQAKDGKASVRSLMIARAIVIAAITAIITIAVLGVSLLIHRARAHPPVDASLYARLLGGPEADAMKRNELFPLVTDRNQLLKEPHDGEYLTQRWATFRHEPFESSGINHLILPFRFESVSGELNQREGFAFSFLLSNALDWVPGCYCSRHANFIAKRSRDKMISATVRYDPDILKPLMARWHSTHAIGGTVVKSDKGYSGTLRIFNRDSEEKLVKTYDKPRPYFDLLGDMCVDVMRFLGFKPSRKLIAHVRVPRCESHESIVDLGRTAFAEEKSGDEFAIYRRILERDPGFAEVRYWAANQGYWQHKNRSKYESQKAIALDNYLVEAPLMDFQPALCSDKKLAAKYEGWIEEAERMIGEDSPNLLALRLERAWQTQLLTPVMLDKALQVAARYPNSDELLRAIADILIDKRRGLVDCDLAASVAVASLGSRYTPGSRSSSMYMLSLFAETKVMLGHCDEAVSVLWGVADVALAREENADASYYLGQLADGLRGMGLYEKSLKVQLQIIESLPTQEGAMPWHVVHAGVCAALVGKKDVVQDLRDGLAGDDTTSECVRSLLSGYLELLESRTLSAGTSKTIQLLSSRFSWMGREANILLTQADILGNKTEYRSQLQELLAVMPNDRELWILFDAYDRADPRPDSQSFYESLEWLHGDDPWVRRAVKMFHTRTAEPTEIDPAEIEERLSEYKPLRWPTIAKVSRRGGESLDLPPGTVAVAVRKLIRNGKKKKAMDLALRYGHYASATAHPVTTKDRGRLLRAHCNQLFRMAKRTP